jgi:hypothetical protein
VTSTRRRLALAGLSVAILTVLTGCFAPGPQPDPSPAPTTPESTEVITDAGFGVPIRVTQDGGVGELVIESATYGPDDQLADFDFEALKGGFLIVRATWTTIEGETAMIALYVGAEDVNGAEGDRDIFVNELFAVEDQRAGETLSGELKFDIGPGPHTIIVYDDQAQVVARFPIEAAPQP